MLCILYNIIILKPSTIFFVTMWLYDYYCDCAIWCDWYVTVWLWHHSNPNSKFQNGKINWKRKRKGNLNKKVSIQTLYIWQTRYKKEYKMEIEYY